MNTFVCMNDEFCADKEESSECRAVGEKTESCESSEFSNQGNSVKRHFIIIIKQIFFYLTLNHLLSKFLQIGVSSRDSYINDMDDNNLRITIFENWKKFKGNWFIYLLYDFLSIYYNKYPDSNQQEFQSNIDSKFSSNKRSSVVFTCILYFYKILV